MNFSIWKTSGWKKTELFALHNTFCTRFTKEKLPLRESDMTVANTSFDRKFSIAGSCVGF